ncbi:MAG: cob(I)yrinic acid a,c-diamide adenosyltransferase [Bacteroidetes bacterium]|nr:cob(I)yrinic acid a,c-diamide adenosyltransferase [Bacteroidota bacterium]MBU1679343.1 cob(I)yrinic acid a,c-diamide adenosyltransferase [Bacteroidota bacterium]MBU2507595.1 cob(I)yrinic acid a,c-diamide adenosyltransferase [Bacteroidota bacterium]
MKIYTKTGDKGETSLFGGDRVKKNNLRLESYGTVDELNSILGVVVSLTNNTEIKKLLTSIQNQLFNVGADLATPIDKTNSRNSITPISPKSISELEVSIDYFEQSLEPLTSFILPGGNTAASFIHFARSVCRRAERICVSLSELVEINPKIVVYLNRLSDLLFVLARYENSVSGNRDIYWKKD